MFSVEAMNVLVTKIFENQSISEFRYRTDNVHLEDTETEPPRNRCC